MKNLKIANQGELSRDQLLQLAQVKGLVQLVIHELNKVSDKDELLDILNWACNKAKGL